MIQSRPAIGRLNGLRFMPDYVCSPDLWSIQGDILWNDAPLTPALHLQINRWHGTWEQHCYPKGRWHDQELYRPWETEGWLLWAAIDCELIPQGWIVKPDFAGYPTRSRITKPSTQHRWIHRFYRSPVSAHQAQQIIDHSNSLLLAHGGDAITPLVPHVAITKPRRRRRRR